MPGLCTARQSCVVLGDRSPPGRPCLEALGRSARLGVHAPTGKASMRTKAFCSNRSCKADRPSQVDARLPKPFKMDPERPEYHRCNLKWEPAALSSSGAGSFVAYSTGVQVRVEQTFRQLPQHVAKMISLSLSLSLSLSPPLPPALPLRL